MKTHFQQWKHDIVMVLYFFSFASMVKCTPLVLLGRDVVPISTIRVTNCVAMGSFTTILLGLVAVAQGLRWHMIHAWSRVWMEPLLLGKVNKKDHKDD